MKKKLLVGLIGLVVCFGLMLAQEAKPYSYTFTKGIGDCLFTGKTLDEVWGAAVKALLVMKYSVTVASKDAGTITAIRKASALENLMLGMYNKDFQNRAIDLVFEKREIGIGVIANTRANNTVIKKLYNHMGDFLYLK